MAPPDQAQGPASFARGVPPLAKHPEPRSRLLLRELPTVSSIDDGFRKGKSGHRPPSARGGLPLPLRLFPLPAPTEGGDRPAGHGIADGLFLLPPKSPHGHPTQLSHRNRPVLSSAPRPVAPHPDQGRPKGKAPRYPNRDLPVCPNKGAHTQAQRPSEVQGSDFPYLRTAYRFASLFLITDPCSRKIDGHPLPSTIGSENAVRALERAIASLFPRPGRATTPTGGVQSCSQLPRELWEKHESTPSRTEEDPCAEKADRRAGQRHPKSEYALGNASRTCPPCARASFRPSPSTTTSVPTGSSRGTPRPLP